jgi:hypothetical protein
MTSENPIEKSRMRCLNIKGNFAGIGCTLHSVHSNNKEQLRHIKLCTKRNKYNIGLLQPTNLQMFKGKFSKDFFSLS